MPVDRKPHIILLPAKNYWDWVQAVRDYAVHFQASVTPRPENALNFKRPSQVITIVDAPLAYAGVGEDTIADWFETQDPAIPLDIIPAKTPHELRQVTTRRVESGQQFGTTDTLKPAADLPIRLRWPTDYPTIVQPFGSNPDVYRHWGLPGHDGVDIRAPLNSNVYACADGEVYQVHDGRGGHAYGIHVRIRHEGGFKTIYAHLNQAKVHSGEVVSAGDVIGLADGTGNSTGSVLHLTLKKEGATAAGESRFPGDIVDPTPYLVKPAASDRLRSTASAWPSDATLIGLNARHGSPMQDADWAVIRNADVEALKLLPATNSDAVSLAREINPDMFLLAGLYAPAGKRPLSPARFVDRVSNDLKRFYERGARYFEIQQEPNLTPKGYGVSWQDGYGFGQWFLEVVGLLRPTYPEARFGWPGLSNGSSISGIRFDHEAFLESSEGAIRQADWIGVHCHWHTEAEMFEEAGGLAYELYLDRWPDKPVLITSFSNPAPDVDPHVKGAQYLQYYKHLRNQSGVGAAFAFVVSSVDHYAPEVWRTEDGQLTAIVASVAAREF